MTSLRGKLSNDRNRPAEAESRWEGRRNRPRFGHPEARGVGLDRSMLTRPVQGGSIHSPTVSASQAKILPSREETTDGSEGPPVAEEMSKPSLAPNSAQRPVEQ